MIDASTKWRIVTYFVDNKATVRAAAKEFNVSSTTVHNVLTKWIPEQSAYKAIVATILSNNKQRSMQQAKDRLTQRWARIKELEAIYNARLADNDQHR